MLHTPFTPSCRTQRAQIETQQRVIERQQQQLNHQAEQIRHQQRQSDEQLLTLEALRQLVCSSHRKNNVCK